jgi:hypothetical protein
MERRTFKRGIMAHAQMNERSFVFAPPTQVSTLVRWLSPANINLGTSLVEEVDEANAQHSLLTVNEVIRSKQ